MKAIILLLPLVLVCGCASIKKTSPLEFVNLNFENNSYLPWEGQYKAGNFEIVTDATPGINNCGKFYLGEGGDYWVSPNNGSATARSELQVFNSAQINTGLYYTWDFMIAADYVESSDWQVIGQFHDQPDAAAGESWATYPAHSPPVSVKYKNGILILAVYSWATNSVMDIATANIDTGKWYNLKLRIFWSEGANGSLRAWIDNQPIASAGGATVYMGRNSFNKACNYLKIGLYRSNNIMTKGIVFFDNIKSYLAND